MNRALYSPLAGLLAVAACIPQDQYEVIMTDENIEEIDPVFPTRTKGVVEKCNFCAERLAEGKPPACVEACKAKALIFGDLEDSHSEVREILHERYSIRRKPELGTMPQIYYLV